VNHCAPDAQRSELLDASSSSQEPLSRYAHIHCWHTDEKFSKHHFSTYVAQVIRTSMGKLASCQSWKGDSNCLLIGGGTT